MYILYNGSYFLTSDYKPTQTIGLAQQFMGLQSAQNFITHAPKTIRNLNYEVKEVSSLNSEDNVLIEQIPVKFDETLLSSINVTNVCQTYQTLIQQYVLGRNYYCQLLSNAEKEQQDLVHAIEFQQLDIQRGFKLYKRLHDVRVNRRRFKNILKRIDILTQASLSDWLSGEVVKHLGEIDNQYYVPRINSELFK